jgi:hypothetical protein
MERRINALREWLARNQVASAEVDKKIQLLKDSVFEAISAADIKPEYYRYLRLLLPFVDHM